MDKKKIIWSRDMYSSYSHERESEYRISGGRPLQFPRRFGRNCEADIFKRLLLPQYQNE